MKSLSDRAFFSFRIGVCWWLRDDRFQNLMRFFQQHRELTDEITFFTSETHPPLPIEVIRERAVVLKKRIAQAHDFGLSAGINVLSTIGHHEENLPHSLRGDYQRMQDMDGKLCQGSFCPNDPAVRAYVRDLYAAMAAAQPDHIWIDDDVRLYGHNPILETCFCDRCLRLFAEEYGQPFTREELKAAFNSGTTDEKLTVRRHWLQHNADTLNRLLALIEQTVHDLNPQTELGLMTCEHLYSRYDFQRQAATLSGHGNAAVRWRPGGGFYEDGRCPECSRKPTASDARSPCCRTAWSTCSRKSRTFLINS